MAGKKTEDIVRCSFCNKTQSQVRKMIAGPSGTYICDDCVAICTEIIEEELDFNDRAALDDINLLTPEEMKAFLDEYVIGQNAKKALSIADRAYVLETGKITMSGNAKDLLEDEAVKKAYLGE